MITELLYLYEYTIKQLWQITPYYLLGVFIGSFVSVFLKKYISSLMERLNLSKLGILGIIPACFIGIISPLCLFGTIPVTAALRESKMREDWIVAFTFASILMNPQLFFYSLALGTDVAVLRLVFSVIGGLLSGILIYIFFRNKDFFDFKKFNGSCHNHDICPNPLLRYIYSVGRNFKCTGGYFLLGIALTSLYQRYVPREFIISLFGNNRGLGSLMATALGVPLYQCGGGTIPLIKQWMWDGMTLGCAMSFMIAGQAIKLTNITALASVLNKKHLIIYVLFVALFSCIVGIGLDLGRI